MFGAVHPHTEFQKSIGKGVSHLRYGESIDMGQTFLEMRGHARILAFMIYSFTVSNMFEEFLEFAIICEFARALKPCIFEAFCQFMSHCASKSDDPPRLRPVFASPARSREISRGGEWRVRACMHAFKRGIGFM